MLYRGFNVYILYILVYIVKKVESFQEFGQLTKEPMSGATTDQLDGSG